MPVICPTITATSSNEYTEQMQKVASFAHRIQIDLADGRFAPRRTVEADAAWWPIGIKADIHLMYENPLAPLMHLLKHKPHLIIVHAEAAGNFKEMAGLCHHHQVKIGIALLPQTPAEAVLDAVDDADHILIFSGNLGFQGGSQADLKLLSKVGVLKQAKSSLEIGWDGGVQPQNASQLVFGGVDVLNVGGFIQTSDDPQHSYKMLSRIADETGTT